MNTEMKLRKASLRDQYESLAIELNDLNTKLGTSGYRDKVGSEQYESELKKSEEMEKEYDNLRAQLEKIDKEVTA